MLTDKAVVIRFNVQTTMLDTKIISVLAKTGDQNCYLCGSKPSNMNNIERALITPLKTEHLRFGISPLHAQLKSLDYILHVSYKLGLQRYTKKNATKDELDEMKTRTSRVRESLKDKLGMLWKHFLNIENDAPFLYMATVKEANVPSESRAPQDFLK